MSLEEEFENQLSWRTAHEKLTFILCTPSSHQDMQPTTTTAITAAAAAAQVGVTITGQRDYVSDENMIGDVNFFLYPFNGDDEEETAGQEECLVGEIDVMVAERACRERGIGQAAVRLLMLYVHSNLGDILEEYDEHEQGNQEQENQENQEHTGLAARRYRHGKKRLKHLMAKIKVGNVGSRKLFGGLGFEQRGEVNYFGEVVMVLAWEDVEKREWWDKTKHDYKEIAYVVD